MKPILYALCLVALASVVSAQERVTLTTPITKPSQTDVKIERILIDVVTKSIMVQWLGTNGEAGSAVYLTPATLNNCSPQVLRPTGAQLITTLNTSNLTSNSLVKRVLTRLQTDCDIPAGSISGSPE